MRDVLNAYKEDRTLDHRALVVLGPYMPARKRLKLTRKASSIPFVDVIEFDNRMEQLVAGAKAVVAMGGYNTYCEILSFDKPTLLVPRVVPRREQAIRAQRAQEVGLVHTLPIEHYPDVDAITTALAALPGQPKPSASGLHGLLHGLDRINDMAGRILRDQANEPVRAAV